MPYFPTFALDGLKEGLDCYPTFFASNLKGICHNVTLYMPCLIAHEHSDGCIFLICNCVHSNKLHYCEKLWYKAMLGHVDLPKNFKNANKILCFLTFDMAYLQGVE
jgi:hypothetical protein